MAATAFPRPSISTDTDDLALLIAQHSFLADPIIYLEAGKRYYWRSGEADFSNRSLEIYGGGYSTEIAFISETPTRTVVLDPRQPVPTPLEVSTAALGPYIHGKRAPMRALTIRNVRFIGHIGSAAVAGHYVGGCVVAHNVTFDNVAFDHDVVSEYDATAGVLSPYKGASKRNFTSWATFQIGADRWVEPDPNFARAVSVVNMRGVTLNGEPATETSGITGVVTGLRLRKCASVNIDSKFGHYFHPYSRMIGDFVLSGDVTNNDLIAVNDWNPALERFSTIYYGFSTTPSTNAKRYVKFSAVPISGATATQLTITPIGGSAIVINARDYDGSPPADSAPDYYVDTDTWAGAPTLAANIVAFVAAVATKINGTPVQATAVAGGAILRVVEDTAGANATLTAETADGESVMTTYTPDHEVLCGTSALATVTALIDKIGNNRIDLGGTQYHHALRGEQYLPGAPPTVTACRIQQLRLGDGMTLNPETTPDRMFPIATGGLYITEIQDTGSKIVARDISNAGSTRRRFGAWQWGIVLEDCAHGEIDCDLNSPTFARAGVFDVSTGKHNDFNYNEWSEGGHKTFHFRGEGTTVVDGLFDHAGAGFIEWTDRLGQCAVANVGTARYRVRKGTHIAKRLTLTSTNAVDGDQITLTDTHGTDYVFEFDDDAAITGDVAVEIGATAQGSLRNLRIAIRVAQMQHAILAYCDDAVDVGSGSFALDITFPTFTTHGTPAVVDTVDDGSVFSVADNSQPYLPHSYRAFLHPHWTGFLTHSAPILDASDVYGGAEINVLGTHQRVVNPAASAQAARFFLLTGVPTNDATIVLDDGTYATSYRFNSAGGTDVENAFTVAFAGGTPPVDAATIVTLVIRRNGVLETHTFTSGTGIDTLTAHIFAVGADYAAGATNLAASINTVFGTNRATVATATVTIPRRLAPGIIVESVVETADPGGDIVVALVEALFFINTTTHATASAAMAAFVALVNETVKSNRTGLSAASNLQATLLPGGVVSVLSGLVGENTTFIANPDADANITIIAAATAGTNGSDDVADQTPYWPLRIRDCTLTKVRFTGTPFAAFGYSAGAVVEQWGDSNNFPTLADGFGGYPMQVASLEKTDAASTMQVVFETDLFGSWGTGRRGAARLYDGNDEFNATGVVVANPGSNFIDGEALR